MRVIPHSLQYNYLWPCLYYPLMLNSLSIKSCKYLSIKLLNYCRERSEWPYMKHHLFLKNIPSHPIGPQLQLIYWQYRSVGGWWCMENEGPFREVPLSPPRRMHVSRWFSQDMLVIIKSSPWMIFMTIPVIGPIWRPFWFFGKF